MGDDCRGSDESQPNDGSKIGKVNFVVSCSLSAQQKFNHAVAILHSFWYEEAESAFTDVIKTDPSCAMGYWGIAMSNWHPLWYPPSAEELSAGSKAAAAAAALGGKTDRERNYIDAISAFPFRTVERCPLLAPSCPMRWTLKGSTRREAEVACRLYVLQAPAAACRAASRCLRLQWKV